MKLLVLLSMIMFHHTMYGVAQEVVRKSTIDSVIFKDDFDNGLKPVWITEFDTAHHSSVFTQNGSLVVDVEEGATVWLNKMLHKNILIQFTREVVMAGGLHDRLSDLNVFWMATDPRNKNLFTRNGVLASYDSLTLYYVGMGGNSNSTTRFRKYPGTGERKLLKEYSDTTHLLQANRTYVISILVKDGVTSFFVNGKEFFRYNDDTPLKDGYFAFRSTKSRQRMDNIIIYQLK